MSGVSSGYKLGAACDHISSIMNDWDLTEESFDLFLSWLDPDRDLAGKRYESIRRRLIIMLDRRK